MAVLLGIPLIGPTAASGKTYKRESETEDLNEPRRRESVEVCEKMSARYRFTGAKRTPGCLWNWRLGQIP
jgi:hypothetical protein